MAQPAQTPLAGGARAAGAALDVNETWGEWGAVFFRNMRTWNAEMARFVGRRLEHDGRTLERLACCSDMGEMAKVQQEWVSETTDHYMREGRRLAEIAMANGAGKDAPGG